MEICNSKVYMIEIQDLEGVQEKMSSLGGPTLKKKKKLLLFEKDN